MLHKPARMPLQIGQFAQLRILRPQITRVTDLQLQFQNLLLQFADFLVLCRRFGVNPFRRSVF